MAPKSLRKGISTSTRRCADGPWRACTAIAPRVFSALPWRGLSSFLSPAFIGRAKLGCPRICWVNRFKCVSLKSNCCGSFKLKLKHFSAACTCHFVLAVLFHTVFALAKVASSLKNALEIIYRNPDDGKNYCGDLRQGRRR